MKLHKTDDGKLVERLNTPVLKTGSPSRGSRVRIPHFPPFRLNRNPNSPIPVVTTKRLLHNKKMKMLNKGFLLIFLAFINLGCSENFGKFFDQTEVQVQTLKPIQKNNKIFNKFGTLEKFEWAPPKYQIGFVYDVYYYIPKSIVETQNSPALIFMHGGGNSTLTREGSNKTVLGYSKTVIAAAEKYKFIAILPSANGLNWGGHTETLLNGLADLARNQLYFDTNRLGVSGHSMGGMGLTRTFNRLANHFSFVNALSAGMNDTTQVEERLIKMYNIKYSHQLGTQDHFTAFIDWTKQLEKNVKKMEDKYGDKSFFEIEWFQDKHVYTSEQTAKLEELFKWKREIYQKKLYGQIFFDDVRLTENNIQFHLEGDHRYLWIENISAAKRDNFNFQLLAENNKIEISFSKDQNGNTLFPQSKKFKLYLSSKIFDLEKDILVYVEGDLVARYSSPSSLDRRSGFIVNEDPNTKYNDVFEFSF